MAGERLPASYINHYIANGGAVVPAFGARAADTDKAAVEALQKAYGPDRKVSILSLAPAIQAYGSSADHHVVESWRTPRPVVHVTEAYQAPLQLLDRVNCFMCNI